MSTEIHPTILAGAYDDGVAAAEYMRTSQGADADIDPLLTHADAELGPEYLAEFNRGLEGG